VCFGNPNRKQRGFCAWSWSDWTWQKCQLRWRSSWIVWMQWWNKRPNVIYLLRTSHLLVEGFVPEQCFSFLSRSWQADLLFYPVSVWSDVSMSAHSPSLGWCVNFHEPLSYKSRRQLVTHMFALRWRIQTLHLADRQSSQDSHPYFRQLCLSCQCPLPCSIRERSVSGWSMASPMSIPLEVKWRNHQWTRPTHDLESFFI
jgi:hypothetical protein